jgi:hypothetical protein
MLRRLHSIERSAQRLFDPEDADQPPIAIGDRQGIEAPLDQQFTVWASGDSI